LKYDLLTFKITSCAAENDTIKLDVLKNPNIDTEIISLALLAVTMPRTQVNASDSSYKPRSHDIA